MTMQQIIAQEAGRLNAITQLLPTIGMLVQRGEEDPVGAISEMLQLQNVPQESIDALHADLFACVDRVREAMKAKPVN